MERYRRCRQTQVGCRGNVVEGAEYTACCNPNVNRRMFLIRFKMYDVLESATASLILISSIQYHFQDDNDKLNYSTWVVVFNDKLNNINFQSRTQFCSFAF